MALRWQSKLILLLVLPIAGANLVLQAHFWMIDEPSMALWTLGISASFGLLVWRLRAGTPGAALAGICMTASLMFSTMIFPYSPLKTALAPLVCVVLLSFICTRIGDRFSTGDRFCTGDRCSTDDRFSTDDRRAERQVRVASQVAANLGVAMLVSSPLVQNRLLSAPWFQGRFDPGLAASSLAFASMLAALSEAAADTVSSEIGQVIGGRPRLMTTLRTVEVGTDGAVSLGGTLAGVLAALAVSVVGSWALGGSHKLIWISTVAGVFGLFFDSLLGATLERRGHLNNDAVNFLSTLSAAVFAGVLVVWS